MLTNLIVDLPAETIIWRYVRLNGFLELLTGRLSFTRADCFDDKNEGGYGYQNDVVADDVYDYLSLSRTRYVDIPPGMEVRRYPHEAIYFSRLHTLVNCWVQQDIESYAMWNIYGRPRESVALVSTVGKLANAIRGGVWQPDVEGRIGLVAYAKPAAPITTIAGFFFHKRPHFEFEREIRAVITSRDEMPKSYSMPIDGVTDPSIRGLFKPHLDHLLSGVVVAPGSRLAFREAVEAAITRVTGSPLLIPVKPSSLDEDIVPEPVYRESR